MTSLYLIEPRTRRRAPAAPDPFDDQEWCEGCGCPLWGNGSCPACGAVFDDDDSDADDGIAIPPSPSDLLRERVSRADWSIFDSDDDRAIAPRGRVVRAGLVAMMLAALAALAAEVFVR